jgi:hypothetical protein
VLPALPSNEKNSFDHHTPTIKVQILCSLASWKALVIPYLP